MKGIATAMVLTLVFSGVSLGIFVPAYAQEEVPENGLNAMLLSLRVPQIAQIFGSLFYCFCEFCFLPCAFPACCRPPFRSII